jgi:hypothetical protein
MDFSDQLLQLEPQLRESCVVLVPQDGVYLNILKGAVIKSFEFAKHAQRADENVISFFLAPSLRGICEDLIALQFLKLTKSVAARDELLERKAYSAVSVAIEKQSTFFRKHRPNQPVYRAKPKGLPKGDGLPPMKDMAERAKLVDVFDFIYAISSDCVHFNPRILIRNAWGNATSSWTHSTRNFELYYSALCKFYGVYLLSLFLTAFAEDLGLSPDTRLLADALANSLLGEPRWPEALTYEEMNKLAPSYVKPVMLSVMARAISDAKMLGEQDPNPLFKQTL